MAVQGLPAKVTREQYDDLVEACPEPIYHQSFRYCPRCPWAETGYPGTAQAAEEPRWKPRYIVQKAPGVGGAPIPADEPCLVIRAQDILAPVMLKIYQVLYDDLVGLAYKDTRVLEGSTEHLDELQDWQQRNQSLVKWADR